MSLKEPYQGISGPLPVARAINTAGPPKALVTGLPRHVLTSPVLGRAYNRRHVRASRYNGRTIRLVRVRLPAVSCLDASASQPAISRVYPDEGALRGRQGGAGGAARKDDPSLPSSSQNFLP